MNCPYCGHHDSKVVDSRDVNDGIRRRRECLACGQRFTTYERIQPVSVFVVKKDQRREGFNREKLLAGLHKACGKRPLPSGSLNRIVDEIEAEIYKTGRTEISSEAIGDMVMTRLKGLDHIAYLRFASVYRDFADITTLKEEIDTLARSAVRSADQLPLLPPEDLSTVIEGRRRNRR